MAHINEKCFTGEGRPKLLAAYWKGAIKFIISDMHALGMHLSIFKQLVVGTLIGRAYAFFLNKQG